MFSDDAFSDRTLDAVAIRNAHLLLLTKVTTMDTMMLYRPRHMAPALASATGLELTREETLVLQALWLNAERVDWAVYERLRLRVLAWGAPASAAADGRKK